MAYEFKFPDVGEGIHEGTIVKWKVKVGDTVEEDGALGEIETAKAIVEIPSPKSGVILKLGAEEGGTIKVGDVLAVIGEDEISHGKGVGVVGDLPEAPEETPPKKSAPKKSAPKKTEAKKSEIKSAETEINVLPYVRKLAEKLNVNLSKIDGTGPGGRITEDDVKKAAGKPDAETDAGTDAEAERSTAFKKVRKYDMWGYIEHKPFKGIRKTIGQRMAQSKFTAPHVTHFDECDVTGLYEYREKEKEKVAKKGIKLTYLPFIVKAAIKGLQEYPELNASLDEANEDIIIKKYYNIGIAMDTPAGLMVPVVKGAQKKSISEIAKEIERLAEKARSRKIDIMDLQGGTFTITNVGSLGGTFFTPIINYPEVAILGVGAIKDKPWIIDKGGSKKIEARKILTLGVTFDHRVIDGAAAARFLNTVMKYLATPDEYKNIGGTKA